MNANRGEDLNQPVVASHSIVRNQPITGSNINYHSSEFDNGNVNSVTLDGVNATNSTFGISIID